MKNNGIIVLLIAIAVGLGISISGLLIANSIKYFRNFDRYVEVKGLAERMVKSDQASWQIGFTASSNNLKDIYSKISLEQQVITKFLVNQGFKVEQIHRLPISIIDNFANAYGSNNAKLSQYSVNAGINVTTNEVDRITKAVQLTNQLVESGVILNNNSVVYSYTQLNSIKANMLDEALANAKIAAQEFAKNSQSKLGKIKLANQGLFTINAPDNTMNDNTSIVKKVRVVTTVQFFLQ